MPKRIGKYAAKNDQVQVSNKSVCYFLVCLFDVLPAERGTTTRRWSGKCRSCFLQILAQRHDDDQVDKYGFIGTRVHVRGLYMHVGGTHYVMFIIGKDLNLAMLQRFAKLPN